MKSNIKFVRCYEVFGRCYYDVIYKSGRMNFYSQNVLPKTIISYLQKCGSPAEYYDAVFKRNELIYSVK